MSHIRYHVPNRQTKEYRGGGATALGILTSKPAVLLPGRQILVSTQKCGRSKNPFGRDDSERNPFACQVQNPGRKSCRKPLFWLFTTAIWNYIKTVLFRRREKCITKKEQNESVLNKFNPIRNTLNAASSMIIKENQRNTNSQKASVYTVYYT